MDEEKSQKNPCKGNGGRCVPFLEVAATYLLRFAAIYVMFRVMEDVDSIHDLLLDESPYVGVDPALLVLAVGSFASLCWDCYCRFRTGCWTRSRWGVQKYLWTELVLVPMALLLLLVHGFAWTETKRESVNGITWRYTVSDGNAIVGRGHRRNRFSRPAISVSAAGHLAIPRTLGGHPVAGIGGCAFHKCRRLTSVAIPEGVTSIAPYAFYDCSGLSSVSLPESVKSIWDEAFCGCRIEKIYIEKGDAERVRELLRGAGVDLNKVEFVERDEAQTASAPSFPVGGQSK